MAGKASSRRYAPSFLLGALLVPLSAVAAFALVSGEATEPVSALATEPSTAAVASVEVVAETTSTTMVDPRADLEAACGEDGWSLVEAEADGSITDLEQAALDALRPICAEAGMELAGPPAPPPVIRTVTVSSGGGGSDAPSGDDSADHDDDYDDDDDHEEDDDHDEDEEDEEDEEDDDDEDGD